MSPVYTRPAGASSTSGRALVDEVSREGRRSGSHSEQAGTRVSLGISGARLDAGRELPVWRRDSSDDQEHADPNGGNGGSHPGLRPRVDLARSEHHHHQADADQEHAGASDDRETDREHPHRASFAAALPSPQSAWPRSLSQAGTPPAGPEARRPGPPGAQAPSLIRPPPLGAT